MKKLMKKGYRFYADIFEYFHYGWQSKLLPFYFKAFFKQFVFNLNKFRHNLFTKKNCIKHIDEEKVHKLKQVVEGLHTLLPPDVRFSYSVLMAVKHPRPAFFKKSVYSVLNQTTQSLEILVGFEGHQAPEIYKIIETAKQEFPNKIKEFQFEPSEEFIINHLAHHATGHFLFLMGQEDWIRPDLLFRYEQTLRISHQVSTTVLYCNENQINELDYCIPASEIHKPILHLPYFFDYFTTRGMLIPKELWDKTVGFRFAYKGAEEEELILQLDLAGAIFQSIPICLYSQRAGLQRIKSREIFIKALCAYVQAKGLAWKWVPGYGSKNVRAIPLIQQSHTVQVIIPFKDQKALTLSCVHHVLKQKDVKCKITAIDNASQDVSISEELRRLGVEVLTIHEPFNYSRLNNLAVTHTQTAQECDLLLFLNNDVDLKEEALVEMTRWIDQPGIGMVGCRLHYPDGRLQHGGVHLDFHRLPYQMHWEHSEKLSTFDEMKITKQLGIVHAITAACALIKRQDFLKVGGFDEIWYPIAYSDTNLAIRLSLINLKCFYTPYAAGIHHESISRKEGIEDYENSQWLHRFLLQNQHHLPTYFFH